MLSLARCPTGVHSSQAVSIQRCACVVDNDEKSRYDALVSRARLVLTLAWPPIYDQVEGLPAVICPLQRPGERRQVCKGLEYIPNGPANRGQ